MEFVNCSVNKGVMYLGMNRPSKKNALTRKMYEELASCIESINGDSSLRVLVIFGEGDSFTAGNDMSDFADNSTGGQVTETARFMKALMECPIPVVAKVHGMAVGIGTTMLLHCDLVYAHINSKFIMPFINLGLVPEYASSYILPKIVGHRKASEWLLLGQAFGPEEGKEFGLINAIFEDNLDDEVSSIVTQLAEKPRDAMITSKMLMKSDAEPVSKHMDLEFTHFLKALSSEPAQEAFDAFLNKRPINKQKFK